MLLFRRTQRFNAAAHQFDPMPPFGKVVASIVKRFGTQTGNVNHGKAVVRNPWLRFNRQE